jgi:hypothetical protein
MGLAILGFRLLNSFDPLTFTRNLQRQINGGIRLAAADAKKLPTSAQAQLAQEEAIQGLTRFKQVLSAIADSEQPKDSQSLSNAGYQLISIWGSSSNYKLSIPSSSDWFEQVPSHPNWLLLPHEQLSAALQAGTGVPPRPAADFQWIERRLAELVKGVLPALAASGDWIRVASLIVYLNQLLTGLASRLQCDEAMMLMNVIVQFCEATHHLYRKILQMLSDIARRWWSNEFWHIRALGWASSGCLRRSMCEPSLNQQSPRSTPKSLHTRVLFSRKQSSSCWRTLP